MTRRLLHALLVLAFPLALDAQEPPRPSTAAPTASTLRVFIDNCPCSDDFLRTELTFIDHVRDRTESDVHVLFGNEGTGAGGRAYTVYFIGLRAFSGTTDTLTFATEPSATEHETRQAILRYLKMGLMRFVARTSFADRIQITLAPAAEGAPARVVNDPWNFWVFRSSVSAGGDGQKSRTEISTDGSLTATRITERWKTRISAFGEYDAEKVTIPDEIRTEYGPDGTTVVSVDTVEGEIDRNYSHEISGSAYLVRSLGQHFSVGALSAMSISSFANNDLFLRVAPAIEYSFFPYSESARRQLFVNYSLGVNILDYEEETIYYKTKQTVPDHQLQVWWEMTEPWGSAFGSLSGQQYLHDLKLYAATAFVGVDVRLFKGFNLFVHADGGTIYNQISIRRRGLSVREVLLNRREQATTYRVSTNIGISYTFGSIFNNIVNPRFGNASGSVTF